MSFGRRRDALQHGPPDGARKHRHWVGQGLFHLLSDERELAQRQLRLREDLLQQMLELAGHRLDRNASKKSVL